MTAGIKLISTMLIIVILLCMGAEAEELPERLEGPGVLIRFNQGTRSWAELCLRLFPEAERHVINTMSIAPGQRVTIHLYGTSQGFRQMTRLDAFDTLGAAFPRLNLIAIDCSRAVVRGPNNFEMTLRHEMIHIGFGRLTARTGNRVPLWFDEGVATWSTGRLRDAEPRQLVTAATVDALLPLYSLDGAFPDSRALRELAYQQSEIAIDFIIREYGPNAIKAVVSDMLEGLPFQDALDNLTGGIDFETVYKDYIRQRFPLFILVHNMFSLFTLLAIGVIISYAIYRLRRARIKKRWQEEEENDYYGF